MCRCAGVMLSSRDRQFGQLVILEILVELRPGPDLLRPAPSRGAGGLWIDGRCRRLPRDDGRLLAQRCGLGSRLRPRVRITSEMRARIRSSLGASSAAACADSTGSTSSGDSVRFTMAGIRARRPPRGRKAGTAIAAASATRPEGPAHSADPPATRRPQG